MDNPTIQTVSCECAKVHGTHAVMRDPLYPGRLNFVGSFDLTGTFFVKRGDVVCVSCGKPVLSGRVSDERKGT